MIEVRGILCDELSGRQVFMTRVSELRPRLSLCPSKTEMVRWLSGYLVSTTGVDAFSRVSKYGGRRARG